MTKINKYIINHIKETTETGYKPKLITLKEILYCLLFLGLLVEIYFIYLIFG